MNFIDIITLNFTQTPEFLGQETHAHRIRKTITIRTLPNGATTDTNVPISINGNFIGNGDIIIQLEQNVDNFDGQEFQIATITMYEDGFASYLGLGTLEDIESLDENFQVNYNEDESISTTHTVNINPRTNQNLLSLAKTIASALRKDYGTKRTLFQESFDLIQGTYSFTETSHTFPGLDVYFAKISHTFTLAEDGNVSITEQAEIRGLEKPIDESAEIGVQTEIPLAFGRCLTFFGPVGNRHPLNPQFITKQITRDKFSGLYNYSITFTNNPNILPDYSWEYSISIETNDEQVTTVTESGIFRGYGCSRTEKFNNALIGYQEKATIPEIFARLSSYAPNLKSKSLSSSVSRSQFQGTINYSERFTNDQNYALDDLFLRQEISIERRPPIRIVLEFIPLKGSRDIDNGVIEQDTGTASIGELIGSVILIGKRGTGTMEVYMERAKSLLEIDETCYLSNAQWSFLPQDFQFSFNIVYHYFETVPFEPPLPARLPL